MKVSILVAMSTNRVIGRDGQLPWRLSADLRRFKQLTMGHPIIMGRKTYASIGRPLPGRTSIVLTRQANVRSEGVITVGSLDEALRLAKPLTDEVFVIGGGEVYDQVLPIADRLYVTLVDAAIPGDTFFPEWNPVRWRIVEETFHPADEKNPFPMRFQVFDRIQTVPSAR
jgi:dihydrofolate reductase